MGEVQTYSVHVKKLNFSSIVSTKVDEGMIKAVKEDKNADIFWKYSGKSQFEIGADLASFIEQNYVICPRVLQNRQGSAQIYNGNEMVSIFRIEPEIIRDYSSQPYLTGKSRICINTCEEYKLCAIKILIQYSIKTAENKDSLHKHVVKLLNERIMQHKKTKNSQVSRIIRYRECLEQLLKTLQDTQF